MSETYPYVTQSQERHGDRLSLSWVQSQLHDESMGFLQHCHTWLDEWVEENYGPDRRAFHEQKASLSYMYHILEGMALSLRLPQNTVLSLKHPRPCYWYIPEGNERPATLAIGQEQRSSTGTTWVNWQTTRSVTPNEFIVIPPHVVHAFISSGEEPFYAALVTECRHEPESYRLTLRDKVTISQPRK